MQERLLADFNVDNRANRIFVVTLRVVIALESNVAAEQVSHFRLKRLRHSRAAEDVRVHSEAIRSFLMQVVHAPHDVPVARPTFHRLRSLLQIRSCQPGRPNRFSHHEVVPVVHDRI